MWQYFHAVMQWYYGTFLANELKTPTTQKTVNLQTSPFFDYSGGFMNDLCPFS